MRVIPQFDAQDADLAQRKWRTDKDGYARTTINGARHASGDKRRVLVRRAHRIVLARKLGRPLTAQDVCDHANGDILDNRRDNLRLVDRAGNSQNRRTMGASGYRGVVWNRCAGKWQAQVGYGGRSYYVGCFDTAEAAALAAANKRAELGFLCRAD